MESEQVLVVDDDDAFRNVMVTHLARKGYLVEDAQDGLQAIEKLKTAPSGTFAVMVTDMMMPGMDGNEVIREAQKIDPALECVVITAAGSIENAIISMREHGAYDYLLKPLETLNELSVSVERAAQQRELRMENEQLRIQTTIEKEKEKHLRELSRYQLLIQEEERRRIALDLHDDISQRSAILSMRLTELENEADTRVQAEIRQIKQGLTTISQTVRDMARSLYPTVLEDIGLVEALTNIVQEIGHQGSIKINFKISNLDRNTRFSKEVETAVFRIAQEALANIVRHANVDVATMRLTRLDDELILFVHDKGVGFEYTGVVDRNKPTGLLGMQTRAELTGGTLDVQTGVLRGTTISAVIPCEVRNSD